MTRDNRIGIPFEALRLPTSASHGKEAEVVDDWKASADILRL